MEERFRDGVKLAFEQTGTGSPPVVLVRLTSIAKSVDASRPETGVDSSRIFDAASALGFT